jgi:hypothetical protein
LSAPGRISWSCTLTAAMHLFTRRCMRFTQACRPSTQ